MEKKKKEIILIVILIPVLTYVIYSNVISPRKKVAPPPKVEMETAPVEIKTPKKSEEPEGAELPPLLPEQAQRQDKIAGGPWERDPFNPPPKTEEEVGGVFDYKDFKLTGVVPSPTGGVAIINGEAVGVGEYCRGYLLVEVQSSEITLEKDGKSFILTMPEE